MNSLYLVFSNPLDGREDAYNAWYDEVHVPEVLALPGIRDAQRYTRSALQRADAGHDYPFRYLTVYDLGDDPTEGLASLRAASLTPGDSIAPGVAGVVFDPRTPNL